MVITALNDIDGRLRRLEKLADQFPVIQSLKDRISDLESRLSKMEDVVRELRSVKPPIAAPAPSPAIKAPARTPSISPSEGRGALAPAPPSTTPSKPPIESISVKSPSFDVLEKLKSEMRKELEKLRSMARATPTS
ncbi:MAG: hypothetical protein ACTSXX_10240 [Candidatus Baldrarchaeia archaeon]